MNLDMAIRLRNGHIAAHPGLDGLPPRWRPELVRWATNACKHFTAPKIVDYYIDKEIEEFRREHALKGLDLAASDAEIVDTASKRADNMARVFAYQMEAWAADEIISHTCKCASVPQPKGATLEIRIKRISCMHWWRRQLRRVHARAIENGNIKLQFVQARCEPYASRDAVRRCTSQDERNRIWMESTIMQNEHGDQFTMQALAEKSTSNKAIRRSELMTRMRGVEEVAGERGDVGLFVTITCPSYFHTTLRQSGKVNPNYRGKTPRQAQAYLCKVWGRIRAKLKREHVEVYGMRVAEPHHDACPHWHLIMFTAPGKR
jgi:hypothetical protein